MNGKHAVARNLVRKTLAALILAVAVAGVARAQAPQTTETLPSPRGYPTTLDSLDGNAGPESLNTRTDAYGAPGQAGGERRPPDPVPPSPGLSRYITYAEADCCIIGGHGPVGMELFVRTGPSFILGSGNVSQTLQSGWRIEGGGRSLFFDEDRMAAWTVGLSLSHVGYHGDHPERRIVLNFPIVPRRQTQQNQFQQQQDVRVPQQILTTRYLMQTFANASVGRDWWLWGAAGCEGSNLRLGVDLGGRWGSANYGSHERRHRTDVVGGVFTGAQLLYEQPCCGCCVFHAGLRAEWDWIWSDILQAQNNADITNINLLMQLGFRY